MSHEKPTHRRQRYQNVCGVGSSGNLLNYIFVSPEAYALNSHLSTKKHHLSFAAMELVP